MYQAIKQRELLGLTMGSTSTNAQPEVKHIEDTLTVNVHGKSLQRLVKVRMLQVFIMDLVHN